MIGKLLSIGVLLVISIAIFRYVGYIEEREAKREEEKMARHVVCEVEAPEGLKFQHHQVDSIIICNDGDADGFYISDIKVDEHYDSVSEEISVEVLTKGVDF